MPSSLQDRHLNLWKQQLERAPDWVWDRTDLESLVLAENGLAEISERIGGLRSLRMLDLGHNKLRAVPDALGEIEGLSDFLYLHDNELASLPESLARLTKLRYLNISENAFVSLPEATAAMTGLVELRASDNAIASLPDSIAGLVRLRELHLRNNKLTSLPEAIGSCVELRQIDLRGNPVKLLPAEIAALPRLEKLDLRWVDLPPQPWFESLEARGCLIYR
ncbi:MAG TPA: leucine-rich repeat domain-containing protein [Bryobacteraceae bacterium]|nr:leucine-rich repeat domain-containing protein [Bryobacteraceae bacterium]